MLRDNSVRSDSNMEKLIKHQDMIF